uniref:Uncharacterized protein n=1 Tax=viral metagenome TaxID=1070528 RepID=A0A6C0EX71_9ZZZZ
MARSRIASRSRVRARSRSASRSKARASSRSGGKSRRKVNYSRNKTRRSRKHMKGGCAQCFASM